MLWQFYLQINLRQPDQCCSTIDRMRNWKIVYTLFLGFLCSPDSYAQQMRVHLKNTGDEKVYVAKYYYEWGGMLFHSDNNGWKPIRVSGWYGIEPGENAYLADVDGFSDRVGFAFMKRGGSVVYEPANSKLEEFRATVAVDPVNGFSYTGRSPEGYVSIPTSFETKLGGYGEGILNQYIEIPSYRTDSVDEIEGQKAKNEADKPSLDKKVSFDGNGINLGSKRFIANKNIKAFQREFRKTLNPVTSGYKVEEHTKFDKQRKRHYWGMTYINDYSYFIKCYFDEETGVITQIDLQITVLKGALADSGQNIESYLTLDGFRGPKAINDAILSSEIERKGWKRTSGSNGMSWYLKEGKYNDMKIFVNDHAFGEKNNPSVVDFYFIEK